MPAFDHYGIQFKIFKSFVNPLFQYAPAKYIVTHHMSAHILKNDHK